MKIFSILFLILQLLTLLIFLTTLSSSVEGKTISGPFKRRNSFMLNQIMSEDSDGGEEDQSRSLQDIEEELMETSNDHSHHLVNKRNAVMDGILSYSNSDTARSLLTLNSLVDNTKDTSYQGLPKYLELHGKECGATRQCYNIMSQSLECIDEKCQCSTYKEIQLKWDEKRFICLGDKGHPCVTNAMCHSGKCLPTDENPEVFKCSSAHRRIHTRRKFPHSAIVQLLCNLLALILAKIIVAVR